LCLVVKRKSFNPSLALYYRSTDKSYASDNRLIPYRPFKVRKCTALTLLGLRIDCDLQGIKYINATKTNEIVLELNETLSMTSGNLPYAERYSHRKLRKIFGCYHSIPFFDSHIGRPCSAIAEHGVGWSNVAVSMWIFQKKGKTLRLVIHLNTFAFFLLFFFYNQ
jgi:hypothetical protein